MSFSKTVKKEIFNNVKKLKGCGATSFLTAVLKSVGSINLDHNGYRFAVETENGDLLLLCSDFVQAAFGEECEVYQVSSGDAVGKNKYVCRFDISLAEKLGVVTRSEDTITIPDLPQVQLRDNLSRRAFVQALFLCCGSATIPVEGDDAFAERTHSNYHLELRFYSEAFADFVQSTFAELDFKKTTRKNNVLLYLKDSNKIADFFAFVDAVNARFAVENVIIGRSFRNTANRQSNCIDSNINKAILAGAKQLEAIEKIRNSGKFEQLPQQLKEVAVAREQNHEANLAELASLLKISKSGANHRLTKLLEIAEDL